MPSDSESRGAARAVPAPEKTRYFSRNVEARNLAVWTFATIAALALTVVALFLSAPLVAVFSATAAVYFARAALGATESGDRVQRFLQHPIPGPIQRGSAPVEYAGPKRRLTIPDVVLPDHR